METLYLEGNNTKLSIDKSQMDKLIDIICDLCIDNKIDYNLEHK